MGKFSKRASKNIQQFEKMNENKKIIYLYTGNHPLHLAFANTITKNVAPLSNKIPKNYDLYFVEGDYAKIITLKKLKKINPNAKIIVLFSDPRLFYLVSKKKFHSKKNKVVKASLIKKIVAKKLLKEIDGVICVGKFEAEIFRKLNKDVPIEPVQPFIGLELYNQLIKVKPKLNNKKILFIANGPDFYYKGIDILVESFKKIKKLMPKTELHIIGKWDLKKEWKTPGVYFDGFKNNALEEQYSKNTLYLHLGRGEAFGLVVIEAMLAGIPCIVSNLTGAKEAVEKISKNFVVPLKVDEIVKSVVDYFNLSLKEKKQLSEQFKKTAKIYTKEASLKDFKTKFNKLFQKIFQKPNEKKILFLRYEHIGDYGMGLPVLKAIKEKFPNHKIDVVVGPWNKEFAEATPYIDDIIVFNHPLAKRYLKYKEILKVIFSKEIIRILKFIKKINRKKYDLIISPSDRKFSKPFVKLMKAKGKILGTDIRNTGFDERERLKMIMKKSGIKMKDFEAKINFSKENIQVVEEILKKDKKYLKKIIIHPITPLEEKNWPLDKWEKLIKQFQNKKYKFYLVGTKEQKKELDKIKKNSTKIENLAGKLSIVQTIYLMDRGDLVVGGDSGPVHLAELTKTPIISLFGPTNENMWGTPKEKGKVLKEKNIKDIAINRVFSEIKKIIK